MNFGRLGNIPKYITNGDDGDDDDEKDDGDEEENDNKHRNSFGKSP